MTSTVTAYSALDEPQLQALIKQLRAKRDDANHNLSAAQRALKNITKGKNSESQRDPAASC